MAGSDPKGPAVEPVIELQSHDEQLLEIARAEAVLNKRDPAQAVSVVRAQLVHQATARGREARAASIEKAAQQAEISRRRKRIAAAVATVLVAIAAVPVGRVLLRENERVEAARSALDAAGKGAAAIGFRSEKEWIDVPPAGAVIAVPHDTCAAVIAVREGGKDPLPLTVEREAAPTINAAAGAIWCSCADEKVTVKPGDGGGARRTLRFMIAPAGSLGGIEALSSRKVGGFEIAADSAALACADVGFRAWSEIGSHGDVEPLDVDRSAIARALVADGFEPVGALPSDHTFGVVRAKQGRCYLAAPERGHIGLTLRAVDGARLVRDASGAVVWCSHGADAIFSLWRAEKGTPLVSILSAPADRVGGVGGTRSAARRRVGGDVLAALLPDDLSKDARASLLAATVLAPTIREAEATGLPGQADSTVVALAMRDKAMMVPAAEPAVRAGCAEDRDPRWLRTAICAEPRAQPWHPGADLKQVGGAEGQRPYWLDVLGTVDDEGALRAAAALLAFAQRMTLLGFEPNSSDGVKDAPDGAVVSARPGRGEVVAVGISKQRPWVVPLSSGGAWKSLDDDPPIVVVKPGETRRFTGAAPLAADSKARRVVVWRR